MNIYGCFCRTVLHINCLVQFHEEDVGCTVRHVPLHCKCFGEQYRTQETGQESHTCDSWKGLPVSYDVSHFCTPITHHIA